MQVKVIFVLVPLTILVPLSFCFPTQNIQAQNISSGTLDSNPVPSNHQPIISKLDELVSQRTESIRQIIAAEQKNQDLRTKGLSSVPSHGKKLEKSLVDIGEERFPTLEELRAKCQHYSRLFGGSQTGSPLIERLPSSDISERHASTVLPPRSEYYNRPVIEVTRRPVYIRNKPTFIEKNHGGFYVTASSAGNNEVTTTKKQYWISSTYSPNFYSTRNPTTTTSSTTTTTTPPTTENFGVRVRNNSNYDSNTERPKIKIRYTKYEPVILQKTILTDGRVLYHWHKSLPTAALDLPAPITPIATPILPTYEFPSDVVPAALPLPTRNFPPIEPITAEPTTTTTTEKSSWLFVPFSGLFGGSHEEESSTVESSTAASHTSSTTSTVSTNYLDGSSTPRSIYVDLTTEDVKLQQQLKFIVPINYDEIDSSLAPQNKPWDYNRLAYYPKGQRDTNTVLQQPNYQVIKSLTIPQSIPRYTLGYTGTGYGLTFANGIPYSGYGSTYGAGYGNYQGFEREKKKNDEVSV